MNFLPKVKIEVVVQRRRADNAVEAIVAAAKTGQIGDGKIFVTPDRTHGADSHGETDKHAL